jgi:hypothetical protein
MVFEMMLIYIAVIMGAVLIWKLLRFIGWCFLAGFAYWLMKEGERGFYAPREPIKVRTSEGRRKDSR